MLSLKPTLLKKVPHSNVLHIHLSFLYQNAQCTVLLHPRTKLIE